MKHTNFLMTMLMLSGMLFYSCSGTGEQEAPEVVEVPTIPLRDFFKNPETFRYRLSPNGEYLSYLAPYKNRLNIHVKKVGSDDVVRITSDTIRDVRVYFWANDDQLAYTQDTGGDENWQLIIAEKDGSKLTNITNDTNVRTQIIDDLPNNPDVMLIEMNKNNPQVFDPYRINLKTGELTQAAENPGNITGWGTDHDGNIRIANVTDGVSNTIMYRATEEDEFKEVMTISFKDSFYPVFFTFDNKNVYAMSNLGRDKVALVEYDLENNKEIREVYVNDKYDLSDASYSEKRKVLTHASYTSWRSEMEIFDEKFQNMYNAIVAQVGDQYEVEILSATRDESKVVFVTGSDRSGTRYYIYDDNTGSIDMIANTRPWLKEEYLAEMKPIEYKTRDGLTINGYLTLPVGVEAKNLPLVVNPHGGPWARDIWGLNSEVQFLANRGYAVLQMNFRGSTGYGREFWEASFKEWGKKMQDDVTDGVNYLVDQGIVDQDRIGIYGGSYGGYTTLAGLTFTPDLYACGVDYVGVSNLFTFMNTIPPYWEPYKQMLYEMVGNPETDSLLLASASPVYHADQIKVPLLIAQGAKDPRVNIDESDQMVEALKARGIDTEYIVKENEGHGFSNEENRFEFYEAMEKFFEKHLKIGGEIDIET